MEYIVATLFVFALCCCVAKSYIDDEEYVFISKVTGALMVVDYDKTVQLVNYGQEHWEYLGAL